MGKKMDKNKTFTLTSVIERIFVFDARAKALISSALRRLDSKRSVLSSLDILLVIAREGKGTACTALKNLGLDLEKIRQECEQRLKRIKIVKKEDKGKGVVDSAIEIARSLGSSSVGTGHLLLGTLEQDKSRGAQILRAQTIKDKDIRKEVMKLLNADSSDFGRKITKARKKLTEIKRGKEGSVRVKIFELGFSSTEDEKDITAFFDEEGRKYIDALALSKKTIIIFYTDQEKR